MKIFLASANAKKIREMQRILAEHPIVRVELGDVVHAVDHDLGQLGPRRAHRRELHQRFLALGGARRREAARQHAVLEQRERDVFTREWVAGLVLNAFGVFDPPAFHHLVAMKRLVHE